MKLKLISEFSKTVRQKIKSKLYFCILAVEMKAVQLVIEKKNVGITNKIYMTHAEN